MFTQSIKAGDGEEGGSSLLGDVGLAETDSWETRNITWDSPFSRGTGDITSEFTSPRPSGGRSRLLWFPGWWSCRIQDSKRGQRSGSPPSPSPGGLCPVEGALRLAHSATSRTFCLTRFSDFCLLSTDSPWGQPVPLTRDMGREQLKRGLNPLVPTQLSLIRR